jgi:hypothetical protein
MSKTIKQEYKQFLNNKNKLNKKLEKEVQKYLKITYQLKYGESPDIEKIYIQYVGKDYIQYSYELGDDSREWNSIPTEFIFNRDKWEKEFTKKLEDNNKVNEHNQLAYAITSNIYKADNETIEKMKSILEEHFNSNK